MAIVPPTHFLLQFEIQLSYKNYFEWLNERFFF